MAFSDGMSEDVGSSDYQEHELRANHSHNSTSLEHSKQEIAGCLVVKTDGGSMSCTREADEGRSCGVNVSNLSERTYRDGPRSSRYKVTELECNLNHQNAFCRADTPQISLATCLGSTASLTTAASSKLPLSSGSNSITLPSRFNAQSSRTCSGRPDSDNPTRNGVETCQSSALGRAGSTGSIDVVSRSGLACKIRSNSVQNSALLGRLSVDGRPTLDQPTQDSGVVPPQEPIRNADEGYPGDSSEDLSRESGALRWVQALEFQGTGACRADEPPQEPIRNADEGSPGDSSEDLSRESGALRLAQALEFQGTGACRADERLRPLLRWNVSCVGADGRLLVQLGQHFKAKELNLLARCLCAPLVNIRVGKVLRQGPLLMPTASRGFLSLTMVPGSVMRLSFIPDTGFVDLLATISLGSEASLVSLEEVLADVSGRTFLLKLSDGKVLYFWQSEKSKSTGDELVSKMKDLLSRRRTLSQLTGIEETRLDSFASYICSALNASSTTEASQSPASAASAENLHSCTSSSSTPSTKRTSSHASTFNGGTQPLSLPTALTRSSAEFEGDSSVRPGGLYQRLSQRGLSSENAPTFSIPHSSSSASWPDSSERWHVTVRSRDASLVGPSAIFSGASEGSLSNTHEQPVLLASSWSTRTSLSDSSPEKQETSSLSAGLYASLNTDLPRHGHDVFEKQYRSSSVAPQRIADFSLRSSLPALLGEFSFPSCTCSPPVSSHLPISPASLVAPYYCPCPLGTFTPPYVPSTSEGGLISPSAPFFSVRPPSSLFPPGSLSFHEFSLSPVQLPISTLVTAAIPIQSSGISPFCTQPVSSVPILHKPNPYMARTSSALSGYSSTSLEGLEKSFFCCLRARQAMHDESCSANISTSACPGETSTESATQTQRPVLDRNLAGTPDLLGSFEPGLQTHTRTMFTSRALSQVTPFELGLHYASRFLEENREAPTLAIVEQVPSISSDLKFKERSFFADMVAKTRSVVGRTFHSPESCSTSGGSRTGESPPSSRSESGDDLSHATVKDMAAKISQHTDETRKMEEEKNH